QVKISGFRIEIGEIENRLLRLPGVREGAVVMTERADRSKQLVAFYAGHGSLDANVLRDQLRDSLPEYMVPSAFHTRATLPLSFKDLTEHPTLADLATLVDDRSVHGAPSRSPNSRLHLERQQL